MSLSEFLNNRKIKKEQKKSDKIDTKLDELEKMNNVRMEIAERAKEQDKRSKDANWVKKSLDEQELHKAIYDAKENLWVVRDNVYEMFDSALKEYRFLSAKTNNSPGEIRRKEKLQRKYKNAFYALSLIGQALERLEDIKCR